MDLTKPQERGRFSLFTWSNNTVLLALAARDGPACVLVPDVVARCGNGRRDSRLVQVRNGAPKLGLALHGVLHQVHAAAVASAQSEL